MGQARVQFSGVLKGPALSPGVRGRSEVESWRHRSGPRAGSGYRTSDVRPQGPVPPDTANLSRPLPVLPGPQACLLVLSLHTLLGGPGAFTPPSPHILVSLSIKIAIVLCPIRFNHWFF